MNPLFDMSGWRLVPSTEKSSLKEGTRVRGVNGWAIIEGILEGKSIKVDYYTGSHHWFEIYEDWDLYIPRQHLPTSTGSVVEGNGIRAFLASTPADESPWVYFDEEGWNWTDNSSLLELIGPDFQILLDNEINKLFDDQRCPYVSTDPQVIGRYRDDNWRCGLDVGHAPPHHLYTSDGERTLYSTGWKKGDGYR